MFKKILVPSDGSPLSDKAVAAAIDHARHAGAGIVALCVADPYPPSWSGEVAFTQDIEEMERRSLQEAREHAERISRTATQSGVQCEVHCRQSFAPYEEIVRVASETGCDVIFMASHGRRGLDKLFLGSETQKVLAHTTLPVLVLR